MNVGSVKRYALTGLLLIATSFALPADAAPHGGHGGEGHGGGAGWWGFGLGLGLGWEAAHIITPYYYPAYPVYYYGPPVYYYPASPPAVVISSPGGGAATAPPSAPSVPNWYYCDSAKGYYPYVRQCPEAWRTVPATPPGPTR